MSTGRVNLVLPILFVLLIQPLFPAQGQTPEPIRRALEAVDLRPDQLRFDLHDRNLYGGDRWRLRYFDSLIDRPTKIPSHMEVLQRNLLGSADRPSYLFGTATSRLETGVRRGLILHPVESLRSQLDETDPLAGAILGLWRRSGSHLAPAERFEIEKRCDALPDSLAGRLALLVEAAAGAIDARRLAFAGLSVGGESRGWGRAENRFDGRTFEAKAIAYLTAANEDEPDPALLREVEEVSERIDFRSWNVGVTDLLLTLESLTPQFPALLSTLPRGSWKVSTPFGPIILAGTGHDRHEGPAPLLLLDAGGPDHYATGAAGSYDRPVSILIDYGGNDTYVSGADTLGPSFGAGLLGVGILLDQQGNDRYQAGHLSLGAGFYGIGILVDRAGNDSYDGVTASQGAGLFGVGILSDLEGEDRYYAYQQSQGYGYVRGAGLLIDRSGNDRYIAEDEQIRYPSPQSGDHNASLSQGFGFGKRADYVDGHSLAGGIGILVDGAGSDDYRCGVFGQGAGYWYGTGILADTEGDDTYEGFWYVQGSGAHFALGILWEGAGNDTFRAERNMAIGAGHDFSLGFLYERSGNDQYDAPNLSLGGGNANGIGIFWDVAGDDSYRVERENTLGRGNVSSRGGPRDLMETVGIFLDTGGNDSYPSSKAFAGNDRLWTQVGRNQDRPLDTERGVGLDTTWTPEDQPGWRTRRNE